MLAAPPDWYWLARRIRAVPLLRHRQTLADPGGRSQSRAAGWELCWMTSSRAFSQQRSCSSVQLLILMTANNVNAPSGLMEQRSAKRDQRDSREDRQVRHRQGSRPRQHRRRLPFPRSVLPPRRRDQGLQHRVARRGSRARHAQDVPVGSAHGRHAAASEHPADLRRRRGGRPLLHRHRARARRAHAVGVLQAGQPAAGRRRRRDHLQVREGAALRAQPRRHPSRHQAVEHHAHAGQRRAHHRLRHRAGRGLGDLAHRRHRRQPLVHVAGAGAVAGDHQSLRPVLARRGDVRDAHRVSPVPRRQPLEAAAPDRVRDRAADPHAAPGHPRGAGERGREVAAEGAGEALPQRPGAGGAT